MMGELRVARDKDVAEAHARYWDGYNTAESDIDFEIGRISELVTTFNTTVAELELDHLRKLQAEGILQISRNSKGGDFLVVPGFGKE